MIRKAYAKVNLNLKVLGKDSESGLHRINSLMQLINLYDEVEVKKTAEPVPVARTAETAEPVPVAHGASRIFASGDAELYGEDNLCVKGIRKTLEFLGISEESLDFGIEVSLKKNIPAAAGLGGGSADAAAAILATLDLLGEKLSFDELMRLGISVGSDVPFMLAAHSREDMHACVVSGIGDSVERAEPRPGSILLRQLEFPVSTKDVYAEWDKGVIAAVGENDLEPPAFTLYPQIAQEKKRLIKEYPGRLVLMSGSGPSLFVYFADLGGGSLIELMP
jgi:4-diphosphocytidyl-2-C-methyl-D-erythritol kinase